MEDFSREQLLNCLKRFKISPHEVFNEQITDKEIKKQMFLDHLKSNDFTCSRFTSQVAKEGQGYYYNSYTYVNMPFSLYMDFVCLTDAEICCCGACTDILTSNSAQPLAEPLTSIDSFRKIVKSYLTDQRITKVLALGRNVYQTTIKQMLLIEENNGGWRIQYPLDEYQCKTFEVNTRLNTHQKPLAFIKHHIVILNPKNQIEIVNMISGKSEIVVNDFSSLIDILISDQVVSLIGNNETGKGCWVLFDGEFDWGSEELDTFNQVDKLIKYDTLESGRWLGKI